MAKNKRERDRDAEMYTDAREKALKHEKGMYAPAIKVPKKMTTFRFDKPKTFYIDVIPFVVGKGNPMASPGFLHYERTIYIHKTGQGATTKLCNRKSLDEPCGSCDAIDRLQKHGNIDKDTWKQVSSKEHQVFFFFDRENRKAGVQLFQTAYYKMFGELLDAELAELGEKDPRRRFHSLNNGYTLKVRVRKDSYDGRPYNKPDKIDIIPREEPFEDIEIDKKAREVTFSLDGKTYTVPCMDDLVKPVDYDTMKKLIREGPPDEKEDEDDDDDTDDKEDDDEDADSEDEEEEEEDDDSEDEEKDSSKRKKKGKKVKKGKKKKKDEEEEDEDEDSDSDDDEDEEDEEEDEEEDQEDEDDDSDDEEEDEEDDVDDDDDKPSKKKVKKGKKGKKKKKSSDEDDDDEIPF